MDWSLLLQAAALVGVPVLITLITQRGFPALRAAQTAQIVRSLAKTGSAKDFAKLNKRVKESVSKKDYALIRKELKELQKDFAACKKKLDRATHQQ